MKLPFSGAMQTIFRQNREHDRLYAALFFLGAPAVVMGSMYLVDAAVNLMWR